MKEQTSSDAILDLLGKQDKTASCERPINMDIINELQLQVDANNTADLKEMMKILHDILDYPLTEQAELHRQAMKLGNYDLQSSEKDMKQRLNTQAQLNDNQKQQFCHCCGFVKQQDNIKMCTALNQIKNMGLSTYLFFATFKNLSILLVIMTLVYSIFTLITNVIASTNGSISISSLDYIAISLSSKQQNPTETNKTYYFISCWLGVAMIALWLMALVGIKYKQAKDAQEYDSDTISCSDYSIVIDGLPVDVQQQELQTQFNQYFQQTIRPNDKFPPVWKQPLTIAKINVGKPFYLTDKQLSDEELDQINEDLAAIKEQLIEWMKERQDTPNFKRPKVQRQNIYTNYDKLSERRVEKILQLSKKIQTLLKNQSNQQITTVFITFEINNAKTVVDHIHQTGLLGRIRALCNDSFKRFKFQRGEQQFSLDIRRAPQPEDIIWQNIGHKDCATYGRKILTYTVTLILLGISFAIVFGLTRAQQNANDNRILSVAISIVIAVVNVLLVLIIKFLTYYEKDYTATNREASLAVKSIVAQMINTIVIPVVTAYEIKNNIYSTSGLVDNVFLLGISTAFVPPIMVFVDPYNLYMKVLRCIKSRPSSKLHQTQKEHNLLHQGIQFQLGYHYIYIANVFLFTCFFVSIQPIVSVFSLIGYFMMYWAQKYCMFNRFRRPVPSTDFVNNAVHRVIMLGPLTYSFGSLTWSNLAPDGFPRQALLPNLIAIGISAILLVVPIHTIIYGACFSEQYQKVKKYSEQRFLFPSQYDRLNPSTQEEGITQYKTYMNSKLEDLKGQSSEKRAQILQLLGRNAQRSHQMNQGGMNQQLGGAFANLFGGGNQQQNYTQPIGNNNHLPMQSLFGGLFPAQARPNAMQGFPLMMAGPPQPNPAYRPQPQPRPVYAPNPVGMMVPQRPNNAYQPHPQMHPQMQPQRPVQQAPPPQPAMNPLNMFNLGGNQANPINMNANRGNPHAAHYNIPRAGNNGR